MDLKDAIELIKPALWPVKPGKVWADLGSGDGLFTRALASLLGRASTLHAVDKSRQTIEASFNSNTIVFHRLDFTRDILPFAELDGILMANSLHFIKDKGRLLSQLKGLLVQDGKIVIIEYELNEGNRWIPYPMQYDSLKLTLKEVGFSDIQHIGERTSLYGGRKMYACSATGS